MCLYRSRAPGPCKRRDDSEFCRIQHKDKHWLVLRVLAKGQGLDSGMARQTREERSEIHARLFCTR